MENIQNDINKPNYVPEHQHCYSGGQRGDINVHLTNSHDQKDKSSRRISVFPTTLLSPLPFHRPPRLARVTFPPAHRETGPQTRALIPEPPDRPPPCSRLLLGVLLRVKGRHPGVMQSWVGWATSGITWVQVVPSQGEVPSPWKKQT